MQTTTPDLSDLLAKATAADYAFLAEALKSRINLSANEALDAKIEAFHLSPSSLNRSQLGSLIEHEIRYAGSADVAYLYRYLFKDEAGVPIDKVITDVAKKMNVPIRHLGASVEAKLERLVQGVVEQEFMKMSVTQQRELLTEHGVGRDKIDELLGRIKRHGPVSVIPVLFTFLGREVVEGLVTQLVISLLAQLVGREAAKELIKRLALRFPWWSRWLGPIAWTASGAWAGYDIQGPAYRKTVPVMLYLGLIGLRDGAEPDGGKPG